MDGLNTLDVGTLAGLRGVGIGGWGYGYGNQGNFLGDGSAVKEAVRGNRDLSLVESVNRNGSDRSLSNQIDRDSDGIMRAISQHNDNVVSLFSNQNLNERFSSIERLLFSQQNDNQRDISRLSQQVADCCCDIKQQNAAILSEIQCNQKVNQAFRDGQNQVLLEALQRGNS